jgi:hypothetical protein
MTPIKKLARELSAAADTKLTERGQVWVSCESALRAIDTQAVAPTAFLLPDLAFAAMANLGDADWTKTASPRVVPLTATDAVWERVATELLSDILRCFGESETVRAKSSTVEFAAYPSICLAKQAGTHWELQPFWYYINLRVPTYQLLGVEAMRAAHKTATERQAAANAARVTSTPELLPKLLRKEPR